MNLNAIKQVDFKKNLGFILFFLFVNYFILTNSHQFLESLPYARTSDFFIDGTDFSFIANMFGTILNLVLYLINFIITFLLVLIAIIIFNKMYFKNNTVIEFDKRIKDIKIITLLISVLSIGLLIIINKNLLIIFALVQYLPFPFMIYFSVKYKIKKLYKNIKY